jgi:hypothetical protein
MIRIAVRNPMPLIDVMSKLPQVAEVVEESSPVKHEKTGRLEDGHPPRRIVVNTKR